MLGASGRLGRLVTDVAVRRGHAVLAVGADAARVGQLATSATTATTPTVVSRVTRVRRADEVADAVAGADVAVSAFGGDPDLCRTVLDGCLEAGVPLVDVGAPPSVTRWAHEQRDLSAQAAGLPLVVGAGLPAVLGDLLAAVAAGAVRAPREVHVAFALPDGDLLRGASTGTRRDLAALLVADHEALVDGEVVRERLAEARRLVWFPRPLGPCHAAAVPGAEVVTIPRHVPDVGTVRSWLALSSWRAELLQSLGNAVRWEPVRRRVVGRVQRPRRETTSAATQAATRWAMVVEVVGEDGIARAWANGRDRYRTGADLAVTLAERATSPGSAGSPGSDAPGRVRPAGVLAPAELDAAGRLLDDASAGTGTRWALQRPSSGSDG